MNSPRSSPRVLRSPNLHLKNDNLVAEPPKASISDSESNDENDIDVGTEEDKSYEMLKRSSYLVQVSQPKHKCGTDGARLHGNLSPLAGKSQDAARMTRPPMASPTQPRSPTSTSGTLFWIVGIIVALISLFTVYLFLPASPHPDPNPDPQVRFGRALDDRLSHLKTAFPHQNSKTWRAIRAAVIATAAFHPKTPGVIAAVGTERAQLTVTCLAVALADAIRDIYNDSGYIRVDGASFQHRGHDPSSVKLELDGTIRSGLGSASAPRHVVLVERLDLLPAKSGLLFHGLCDNENAPFKRAIYIITSLVGDAATGDLVDLQVTGAWEGVLDEDQRSSIESRIGNHIVNIVPESASALPSTCR